MSRSSLQSENLKKNLMDFSVNVTTNDGNNIKKRLHVNNNAHLIKNKKIQLINQVDLSVRLLFCLY